MTGEAIVWAETYGPCCACDAADVPLFIPMPGGRFDDRDPQLCENCRKTWIDHYEALVAAGIYERT